MKKHFLFTFLLSQIFFNDVFAQNTAYGTLYTNSTFDSKAINVTLPVGSVAASADVTPAGSAAYTIPIAVPPGTNGVVPQVSVVYNSMGADGPLGRGWGIAGLSAIVRTGRNLYFDGEIKPVQLAYADRFVLDGTRLIGVNGTYGYNNSTYGPEVANFSKATSFGAVGNGPERFEVIQKDGTIMEYGNSSDSRFLNHNSTNVLIWKLNKVRYNDGNYIEYKYVTTDGDSRIDEINYTGNSTTGLAPYNKLKFNYSIRNDVNTGFEAQTPIKSKYLLDNITITAEASSAFKTYTFKYANNNTSSFLIEVTEKGSSTTSLNSTIFKYGDEPLAFPTPASSDIVAGQTISLLTGDFDADGYSDILSATKVHIGNGKFKYTDFKIFKRTADPNSDYLESYSSTFPIQNGVDNQIFGPQIVITITHNFNFLTGDYTGDGADDVLTYKLSNNQETFQEFTIWQSNNATSFTLNTIPSFTVFSTITTPNFINSGDFNGDGRMDVLLMLSNSAKDTHRVYCYYGGISTGLEDVNGLVASWHDADRFAILDFNGDGKSDIMVTTESLTEIFTINSNYSDRIFQGGFPTKWHLPLFGDFNGDRKTDMLIRQSTTNNNAQWEIAISNGVSFTNSNFTFNQTPDLDANYTGDKILISDYNGDGKMDIAHGWHCVVNNVLLGTKVDIQYSKGDNFQLEQYYNSGGNWTLAVTGSADMNGDGRSEWVIRNLYTDPFYIYSFKPLGTELLLERVKNGVGHVTEFSHRRMTDTGVGNTFYSRGSLTAHPLNNIQLPLYLVNEFKADNGIGNKNTVQYSYESAKLHKEGKGLLGFQLVTTNNVTADRKTIVENQFNTTFYVAMPYKTDLRLSNNTLLSYSNITNEFVSLGSQRFWPRVNSVVETKSFEGTTVTSTNTYDVYGNVLLATSAIGTQATKQVATVYGTFGTPIPAKPTSITTTNTRTGQPAYTVGTTLAYNTLGQVTSKTDFSNLAQNIVTTYAYNTLGNQAGVTVTPTGLTARTTTYAFDTKGRFALSETNNLGQVSSATFDAKWGKPLTVTGVDNLTTSFAYDAFGRRTQTTLPTAVSITDTYVWDINATFNSVHHHLITQAGKPDVKTWYDVLGREVRQETEGFLALWIKQKKTYDARGRVATSTAPYKTNEPELTTTHVYDTYNRPTSASNTLGTTTYGSAYSVGNLTTTVTNPASQVSSSVTDATGKLTSATDYGGTLNYTYNSQGNLKEVKLGTTTTLTTSVYDDFGRQTSLIDIDAGTTQYAYNLWGEMTSQTNANAQTHTMTYDDAGRVEERVGPEGTTTYEYFGAGTGASINQLKKITGFVPGNLEEYTYDPFGRVKTVKETIDGTAHTTTYTYNNFGDVTATLYPAGFKVNAAYDANGYLITLKNTNNSVTLFTNTGMNGSNQYTSYTLGNTKTSNNEYYYGIPTRYLTAGVQDLNLTWNYATMNLTSRNDAIKNKTETFTYDNLNRLTGATVTGLTAQTTAFANNGNITSKTGTGTYTYNSGKIHAVESVTNPNGTINTSTQNVTYTPYFQPSMITEGVNQLDFTYAPDYERIKTVTKVSGAVTNTRYFFGNYEKDITGSTTRHIYYVSNGQSLIAIVTRIGTTDTYNYVYTDHLGSILTVTNNTGTITEQQNFDAWGRKRNVDDWTYTGVQTVSTWLYRGYTGHEHLPQFGLINMNGRLYDPVLGRMLSTDNHVQAANSSQNYNRHAYVMNNPLKYRDPSGEFFVIDSWIQGLFDGGFKEAFNRAGNDAKIWGGLFATDSNKKFFGRVWEVASRFTWQLPQTFGGFLTAHAYNTIGLQGGVEWVKYKYGATVLQTRGDDWGGVTLGSYIIGDGDIEADANNPLFQHEYGHYLQSQSMGFAYLGRVGIPSAFDNESYFDSHDFHPVEQDANRRAFLYFNKKNKNFQDDIKYTSSSPKGNRGWDFDRNPLNVDGSGNSLQYVDYQNSANRASLNVLRVTAKWHDYFGIGLRNARKYNNP